MSDDFFKQVYSKREKYAKKEYNIDRYYLVKKSYELMLRNNKINTSSSIMNFGSFKGHVNKYIENYNTMYNFDYSNSMLEHNPEYNILIKNDIKDNSYQDKFDVIFSFLLLEMVENITNAIKKLYSYLKKNSCINIAFFGEDNLKELKEVFYTVSKKYNYNLEIPSLDTVKIGSLLHANNFVNTILTNEYINVKYKNLDDLIIDLKAIGYSYYYPIIDILESNKDMLQQVKKYYKNRFFDKKEGYQVTINLVIAKGTKR